MTNKYFDARKYVWLNGIVTLHVKKSHHLKLENQTKITLKRTSGNIRTYYSTDLCGEFHGFTFSKNFEFLADNFPVFHTVNLIINLRILRCRKLSFWSDSSKFACKDYCVNNVLIPKIYAMFSSICGFLF